MSANGFREDELITRRVNGQTRVFPVVGGRLRLAHEGNEKLSLKTELVSWDGNYAVFRCVATTDKGRFVGYGTANSQRDARLAESLLELSETRSIARSLRFAGYGLEYCGAEEVSHVMETEPDNGGQEKSKGQRCPIDSTRGNRDGEQDRPDKGNGSNPQHCGIEKPTSNGATGHAPMPQSCGNGKATQAQCRALYALTRKARYSEEDIASLLGPLNASTFQELSRESASHLIQTLQTEVAA